MVGYFYSSGNEYILLLGNNIILICQGKQKLLRTNSVYYDIIHIRALFNLKSKYVTFE